MATLQNSVRSTDLTTSLGGTIGNDDVLLVTEASEVYDTGINLTATGLTLKAQGQFSGAVGVGGASVEITGPLVEYRARGTGSVLYLSAKSGGITRVVFAPQTAARGYITSGAGTIATLVVLSGAMTVLQGADVDAVEVESTLDVQADGSLAMTSVLVGPNGRMNTERDFVSANIQGRLVIDSSAAGFTGAVTVRAGGTLRVLDMADAGASSSVTVERGGTIDVSDARTEAVFDDLTWKEGSRLITRRDAPGYSAGGTETGTPEIEYV